MRGCGCSATPAGCSAATVTLYDDPACTVNPVALSADGNCDSLQGDPLRRRPVPLLGHARCDVQRRGHDGSGRRAAAPGPGHHLLPVMRRERTAGVLAWGVALAAYGALLRASAPRWPDDWDGIGFVESIADFDLARFQPHPPGYPVYVALLRLAAVLTRDSHERVHPGRGGERRRDRGARRGREPADCEPRAAIAAAIMVGVTPLVWRSNSGVGSEAPALTCAAACAWGLLACRAGRRAGPVVLGLACGLGLGVRLSWAPAYLAVLVLTPRGGRRRAWIAVAAATLAWSVPRSPSSDRGGCSPSTGRTSPVTRGGGGAPW